MNPRMAYRPISPRAPAASPAGWRVKRGATAPESSLPKKQENKRREVNEPLGEPDFVDEWGQAHRLGYNQGSR